MRLIYICILIIAIHSKYVFGSTEHVHEEFPVLDIEDDVSTESLENEMYEIEQEQPKKMVSQWQRRLQRYAIYWTIQYAKLYQYASNTILTLKQWWHAKRT